MENETVTEWGPAHLREENSYELTDRPDDN